MAGSPYTNLGRPPLNVAALRRALLVPDGLWTSVDVVAETGSTNADLAELARAGRPEGAVLIAESQRTGRGRLGRDWQAPPRAGLTLSVLLRPGPGVPAGRAGWLPLLAGVAMVESIGRVAFVDAALKWPNDLLVRSATTPGGPVGERAPANEGGYGKCAGLLAEAVPGPDAGVTPAIVLGIGLNVSQRADELPVRDEPGALPATSLGLVGALCTDRDPLLRALLRGLSDWYGRWRWAAGDPEASGLRDAYRGCCASLGHQVRVQLPGGDEFTGVATDVDGDGRLVVAESSGARRAVAAGDVWHLR